MGPKISVVVCTYNRMNDLKECLNSLFGQDYSDFEIIVVDDGSTDGTENVVRNIEKKTQLKLKYVKQKNSGLSQARNTGVKKSHGDIISFIDDDCVARKDWLQNLLEGFEEKNIMGVGGKAVPQLGGQPKNFYQQTLKKGDGFFGDFDLGNKRKPVSWIVGCNMSFRRSIFDEVGIFDTRLGRKKNRFLSYEEEDLCYRILAHDYAILYEPKAVVYHKIEQNQFTYDWCFKRGLWQGVSVYVSHKKYSMGHRFPRDLTALGSSFFLFIKKRDLESIRVYLCLLGYSGEKYFKISRMPLIITLFSFFTKLFLLDRDL